MQAWAGIAIAQTALIAFSLWRLSKLEAGRGVRWTGVALFIVAALAMIVLVGDGGYHAAVAVFGTVVLASDAVFLKSVLVMQLCSKPAEEPTE